LDRETWQKGNMNGSISHVMSPYATTPLEDLVTSDDDDIVSVRLADHMQNMSINPNLSRFFGKSSGVTLIQKAIDLKKEYTGDEDIHPDFRQHKGRPEFHGTFPVCIVVTFVSRLGIDISSSGSWAQRMLLSLSITFLRKILLPRLSISISRTVMF
jgi:hypothetical protein